MAPVLLMLAALTQAPSTEQLEKAARRLSSDRFAEREEAAQLLWRAGRAADAVLRKVAAGGDPEAEMRAREILDLHRFGLLPDTPDANKRHIRMFRDGDPSIRKQILIQLHSLGQLDLMVHLINAVEDSQQRDQLLTDTEPQLMQSLRRLMGSKKWDRAESLLEMISSTTNGARHHAAYHLARGTLDEQIERWTARQEDPERARRLTLLHRAKGDRLEALRWARKAGDEMLVAGLQLELKQWRELSDAGTLPTFTSSGFQLEELGFLSMIHKLAGEEQRHREALDKIQALGAEAGGLDQFRAIEALLVNERIDEGLELLEQNNPLKAMQLLTSQFRHVEALEAAGVEPTAAACEARILRTAELIKNGGKDTSDLAVAVEVAIIADVIGMREAADKGFDALAEASTSTSFRQPVIEGMIRNGRRPQAYRHATSSRYSQALFKDNVTEAAHWNQLLKALDPRATMETRWQRMDGLIFGRGEAPDWKALEGAVKVRSNSGSYWLTLAKAALAREELPRAERYLREATQRKYTTANRDLGDLLRRQQRWGEAAEAYSAASPERDNPIDTYLAGHCLQQTGEKEEGERLCRLAMMTPLGSPRKELGTELRNRGLLAGARQCWEFDLLVQQPRSWEHHYASQQLGNMVDEEEPGLAADCWTELMMSTMKAATTFNSAASYVRMPSLVLKMRARQAIDAQQPREAEVLMDRSRRLMPGSISLVEELVPLLDKLEGGRAASDRIYERYREHLLAGLKVFPDCALYHNNLAWMSARCGRRLDEAQEHSQRAVALRPDSAMYLDTLAEVHYQQGDVDKALELMRRCIEIDPRGTHYREQLKRFEAKAP